MVAGIIRLTKEFENPNCKVVQDGNEFTLTFTDTYTYKMVLEQVEKQKEGETQ